MYILYYHSRKYFTVEHHSEQVVQDRKSFAFYSKEWKQWVIYRDSLLQSTEFSFTMTTTTKWLISGHSAQ